MYGTILGIVNSFRGISGSRASDMAFLADFLSQSLWPTAFGLFVGLVSMWFYRCLTERLLTFDIEMENASLDLLNQLSRFPRRFVIGPAAITPRPSRMFGEVPLNEVKRDEAFKLRCMFLAGTALVLSWFAQMSRYFFVNSVSLGGSVLAASISVPIVFAISCLPVYLVWGKASAAATRRSDSARFSILLVLEPRRVGPASSAPVIQLLGAWGALSSSRRARPRPANPGPGRNLASPVCENARYPAR